MTQSRALRASIVRRSSTFQIPIRNVEQLSRKAVKLFIYYAIVVTAVTIRIIVMIDMISLTKILACDHGIHLRGHSDSCSAAMDTTEGST